MPRRVCLKSPARRNYLLTDPGFPGTAAPWGSGLPCHAECQDTPPGRRQEQAPKGPGRGDPGEPRRTRSGELCEPLQAPREISCACAHTCPRAHTHDRVCMAGAVSIGSPPWAPLPKGLSSWGRPSGQSWKQRRVSQEASAPPPGEPGQQVAPLRSRGRRPCAGDRGQRALLGSGLVPLHQGGRGTEFTPGFSSSAARPLLDVFWSRPDRRGLPGDQGPHGGAARARIGDGWGAQEGA